MKNVKKISISSVKGAYENYKKTNIPSLSLIREKANRHQKTCIFIVVIVIVVFIILLQKIPEWQVSRYGINNTTTEADLENQCRATLAQIIGGVILLFGLFFTWKTVRIAQENTRIAQEGQITERFSRAIDHLGAIDKSGEEQLELKLGGIYSLERIAKESDTDYWPIMEILTAYVRKSPVVDENGNPKVKDATLEIQSIFTVIGRRRHSYKNGESKRLDLRRAYLQGAQLQGTNLERANLQGANLEGANLQGASLQGAQLQGAQFQGASLEELDFKEANLQGANLQGAQLQGADLTKADLTKAQLQGANLQGAKLQGKSLKELDFKGANFQGAQLQGADLTKADLAKTDLQRANLTKARLRGTPLYGADLRGTFLEEADLQGAHLQGAKLQGADLQGADLQGAQLQEAILQEADLAKTNLQRANLRGVKNLSLDQLSKVKTLYNTKLDNELLIPLKKKYPALFEKPK